MRPEPPVAPTADGRGTVFWVRVVPGASRASVLGWQADGKLRLAVSAPPERGKANDAVMDLLAGSLGVRRSALSVLSGAGSRVKKVQVNGVSPDRVWSLGQAKEQDR
jgi:hypothetical protein